MKRENPYTRLRREAVDWIRRAKIPNTVWMWAYPKDKLGASWSLTDLAERVRAADQLGHDVRLRYNETDGLVVEYVKRLPPTPGWY